MSLILDNHFSPWSILSWTIPKNTQINRCNNYSQKANKYYIQINSIVFFPSVHNNYFIYIYIRKK